MQHGSYFTIGVTIFKQEQQFPAFFADFSQLPAQQCAVVVVYQLLDGVARIVRQKQQHRVQVGSMMYPLFIGRVFSPEVNTFIIKNLGNISFERGAAFKPAGYHIVYHRDHGIGIGAGAIVRTEIVLPFALPGEVVK